MKRAYFTDGTVIECERECALCRRVRNYLRYERECGNYDDKVYYNPHNPRYITETKKFYNKYIAPLKTPAEKWRSKFQ